MALSSLSLCQARHMCVRINCTGEEDMAILNDSDGIPLLQNLSIELNHLMESHYPLLLTRLHAERNCAMNKGESIAATPLVFLPAPIQLYSVAGSHTAPGLLTVSWVLDIKLYLLNVTSYILIQRAKLTASKSKTM